MYFFDEYLERESKIVVLFRKIFATATLLLIMLTIVNGFAAQMQLALLGSVIVTSIYFKILLIFCFTTSIFLRKTTFIPNWILILISVFIFYLGIDTARFIIYKNLKTSYIIFGINSYYFFYIILPLVYGLRGAVHSHYIINLLWLTSIPLIILGVVQWWTENPLLSTSSLDGSFFVGSWQFDQRVRAFSLFNSPFEFGQFLILVMATSLASLLFVRRSFWVFLIFLFSTAGILVTLTRNVYVGAFFTLVTLIAMSKTKNWKYLIVLPIIYSISAFLLAANGNLFKGQRGITDAQNLNIRLDQWDNYLSQIWRSGLGEIVFGSGYVQNDRFIQSQGTLIDNTYLAIITHTGLLGLALTIIILFSIWIFTLVNSNKYRNPLLVGCCAYIGSCLAMGVFNIVLSMPGIVAILFIISSGRFEKKS